ncbi:unnamed protein product, partial [Ectocarpus sp. 4 AP-2014]
AHYLLHVGLLVRRNLVKLERQWDERILTLEREATNKARELESKHRRERKALAQHQRSSRDEAKSAIPLNGRLVTMKASRENLTRLGRMEEAEKVRRKLAPLERGFWAKALADTGFSQQAKRERDQLLGVQQAELAALSRALRRDLERARQGRHMEVKAQQRKNRCSSDDVWSVSSAAKSGEDKRLSYMLSLPCANVDARDPDSGWTALHFASRQGKLATVRVLIENQAFVGARAPGGRTPLHLAAGWGTYEVCFALLQAGADKTARDSEGETAQQLAECRQRGKVVTLLDGWRPLGLTATQTQKIKESRGEGPLRPWEAETDPEIRSQLRALDMKRCTFGERHAGTHTTLGRLGGLCRAAGRLEDAKGHLQSLVELLKAGPAAGGGSCEPPSSRHEPGALAVALGNLGEVCRELGEVEEASGLLEASLNAACSSTTIASVRDPHRKHLVDAATRNLGLHYLSEGRVEEARPLLRACLESYEKTLQSDMPGGHESLGLITPLTVLSYADMLAGDHAAAAENSARAQRIASKHWEHGNAPDGVLPVTEVGKSRALSDPLPRLEWMGVQRFVAGDYSSSSEFFAQARELVMLRLRDQDCLKSKGETVAADPSGSRRGVGRVAGGGGRKQAPKDTIPGGDKKAALSRKEPCDSSAVDLGGAATPGEFHPDAMRLDRCMAVSICLQGPEAF